MRTSVTLAAAGLAVLAGAVVPLTAGNAAVNPAGNNGTVKIDAIPIEDNAPNNEPHVACQFDIDFYNYADDAVAQILIEGQAPSGSGTVYSSTLNLEKDPAGGGTDWDGQQEIRATPKGMPGLFGLDAHPIQGYHVKLTVNVTSSIGSDVKHKVFWIQPCSGS
ncbi:MAG: hypothetical protein WAN48_00720 [Actinomycetes bacterium]